MANKIQIKHGSGVPGGGKLSSFELGYATQTGQLYISTTGSNILDITPASHSHAWSEVTSKPAQATRWPTWSEVTSKPDVLDYGIRGARIQFTVDGNANTYYPVVVAPRLLSPDMIKLSVSRVYSAPAPDTWNTPTHKGGLTLTVLCTGYGTWSGNSSAYYVVEHVETYSTICSGIDTHVSPGLIFYLRGGGAQYDVTSDCWFGASATVHLGGYTAPNGAVFPAMAYSQAKVDSSIKALKFAPSSHTHAYVPTTRTVNNKALSANISLTAADVGAAASSHSHTWSNITRAGNLEVNSADSSGSYANSAIEIREVNLVGTAQSAPAYAPQLSFHWGSRTQKSIALRSDGNLVTRTTPNDGHVILDGSNYTSYTSPPNLYGASVPGSLLPGQIFVKTS